MFCIFRIFIIKDINFKDEVYYYSSFLFLNLYSKLHSDNSDFANVYEWFVESIYLDLGNPKFESNINNRISVKIIESNIEKSKFKGC